MAIAPLVPKAGATPTLTTQEIMSKKSNMQQVIDSKSREDLIQAAKAWDCKIDPQAPIEQIRKTVSEQVDA